MTRPVRTGEEEAGRGRAAARPVNAVTLADIGRLVAIGAGLAAADVAATQRWTFGVWE